MFGNSKAEHDANLKRVQARARERGIKFNQDKCVFGVSEVSYFGHILSANGMKPDPKKVAAINDMPPPTCRAELETFLGMVTHLTKFAPNMATITAPLRALLKKDVEFVWDCSQETAFNPFNTIYLYSGVCKQCRSR